MSDKTDRDVQVVDRKIASGGIRLHAAWDSRTIRCPEIYVTTKYLCLSQYLNDWFLRSFDKQNDWRIWGYWWCRKPIASIIDRLHLWENTAAIRELADCDESFQYNVSIVLRRRSLVLHWEGARTAERYEILRQELLRQLGHMRDALEADAAAWVG